YRHHRHVRRLPTRRSSDLEYERRDDERYDTNDEIERKAEADVIGEPVATRTVDHEIRLIANRCRETARAGNRERDDVRQRLDPEDRKSTRLNSSHVKISYA